MQRLAARMAEHVHALELEGTSFSRTGRPLIVGLERSDSARRPLSDRRGRAAAPRRRQERLVPSFFHGLGHIANQTLYYKRLIFKNLLNRMQMKKIFTEYCILG